MSKHTKMQPGLSKKLLDSVERVADDEIMRRRAQYEQERATKKAHTKRMKKMGIWF